MVELQGQSGEAWCGWCWLSVGAALCQGVSLCPVIPPPWAGLEGALISSLQAGHEGGGGRGRAGAGSKPREALSIRWGPRGPCQSKLP